jgi:hypothetical protein
MPLKTLIIQSYRTHDVPSWIERCLASVRAWARDRGHDYRLTDDSVFALCGEAYLAKVGDNKLPISDLFRLELIRNALAEGYDQAIWMDADILVFAPDRLAFEPAARISFPPEVWLFQMDGRWAVTKAINTCVVACPRGDPDLDLIIQTIRHKARHHEITHPFQVGVDLIRGMHHFLQFPILPNIGMFSSWALKALAANDEEAIAHQAAHHETPIYAANLCASDHVLPVTSEAQAHAAIDVLERTAGGVVNKHLAP